MTNQQNKIFVYYGNHNLVEGIKDHFDILSEILVKKNFKLIFSKVIMPNQINMLIEEFKNPQINKDVENIFFKNGLFINFIGLSLGLFFGISLVIAQMKFSIVKISNLELAYPVEFNLNNLLLVVFTALFVGLASSYLSSKAVRKLI